MEEIMQLLRFAGTIGKTGRPIPAAQMQLIRATQQYLGEEPCFATDKRKNCAEICEWRRDCHPHKTVCFR